MFKLIQELFSLLTPLQRRRFFILQVLVVIMAVIEIIGIASILPFMALVGDMSLITQQIYLAEIYQMSGVNSESEFIFLLGAVVLIMLFISASVSMYTVWKLSMFANVVGVEISSTLYTYYLRQNWLFHTTASSAQLTKKIATETQRVTQGILVPLMQMNAKAVLVLLLSVSLFAYDPKVALVGLLTFSLELKHTHTHPQAKTLNPQFSILDLSCRH